MYVPPITDIAHVIASPSAAVDFLFENNLIYTTETARGNELFTCNSCGRSMRLVRRTRGNAFGIGNVLTFLVDQEEQGASVQTQSFLISDRL
jgi:hypothetical protein